MNRLFIFLLFLSYYVYPMKINDVEVLDIKELISDEDLICNGTVENTKEGKLTIFAKNLEGSGTLKGRVVALFINKNNFSGIIHCTERCDIYIKTSSSSATLNTSLASGLWQFKDGQLLNCQHQ